MPVVHGNYIYTLYRLVPTRLDKYPPTSSTDVARRIFGQVFMRLSHYSTDMSPHNGIGHIVAAHRRAEGNTTVQVDEHGRIHDWAPMT
jgi:hypothetical protein